MPKKLDIVASLPPLHPGEVLREELLKPMGLTPYVIWR
jgi:antitoxin HigA-1